MRTKTQRILSTSRAVLLLTALSSQVLADNCGSLSDCYDTLGAAVSAAAGLGLFGMLLSMGLDFLPGIGTVKGVIEGITGRDLVTGEELPWWARVLGVVPGLGAVDNIIRDASKAAAHAGDIGGGLRRGADIVDAADPIGIIGGKNVYSYTRNPVNSIDPLGPGNLIKYPIRPELTPWRGERPTGINRAWRQEQELVRLTGRGTRDWNATEMNELLTTGRVTGYTGHHINNVDQFPDWAGDPRNIRFLSTQPAGGDHLRSLQGHRGNFGNPTRGRLIDRRAMIDQHQRRNR